jgi:MIP family channel proteins
MVAKVGRDPEMNEPESRPPSSSSSGDDHGLESRNPWRRMAAEMTGTFLLTFVAAGGELLARRSPDVSPAAKAVAPGLVVLAMIYAVSDVSGAHFNPAVTFAFALRGDFRWRDVPGYWTAQGAAAIAAAALLRAMFGRVGDVGTTTPKMGTGLAFAMEVVLTFALVTVILGTATRAGIIGPDSAIAVGATIAMAGLIFGAVSGASMNPARSLGPAVIMDRFRHIWIYLGAPFVGATSAVVATWLIHGPRDPEERLAAEGDQAKAHH